MITTSDIILKLLKDNGYQSLKQFSDKHNIRQPHFAKAVRDNMWTVNMLEIVGKAFGKDLSSLATARIGLPKGVKYYEK